MNVINGNNISVFPNIVYDGQKKGRKLNTGFSQFPFTGDLPQHYSIAPQEQINLNYDKVFPKQDLTPYIRLGKAQEEMSFYKDASERAISSRESYQAFQTSQSLIHQITLLVDKVKSEMAELETDYNKISSQLQSKYDDLIEMKQIYRKFSLY